MEALPTMRRSKQSLSDDQIEHVLEQATSGVLALSSGDRPYAVPISYVYSKEDGALYFHCATEGHKVSIIRENPAASFCVVAQDEVVPAELTTRYRSVIAFGTISIVEDAAKKRAAAELLGLRYDPDDTSNLAREIERAWNRFLILELKIEHMTGKQARKLCNENRA